MKYILSVIFISMACSVFGQVEQSPIGLSNNLGGIHFNKDEVLFDFEGFTTSKKYYMAKDTLIMIDDYTTSRDKFANRHIDLFKFQKINAGNKILTLIPVNDNARKLSGGAPRNFTNINYVNDATVKFTRLHFKAQLYAAEFSIDIDRKGNYYLKGTGYADPYTGYFKGKLTSKQLDTLNYLLQRSEIEKMQAWKPKGHAMDVQPYILTLYYNDQKLRVQTNTPPMNMLDLEAFLKSTCQKVALVRDPKKRQFVEDAEL